MPAPPVPDPREPRPPSEGSRPAARLSLLGSPELQLAGRAEAYRLDRIEAALFARLALDGPLSCDRLVAELWPGSRASQPRGNLRQLRKKLRDGLGAEFMLGEDQLALDPQLRHDLGALLNQGSDESQAGEFLGEFDYRDRGRLHAWVEGQRERLRAIRRRVDDERVRLLESQGRFDAAIVLAQRMLLQEPDVEDAYLRVARLHWRRGGRSQAQAVIARCRAMLLSEFGARPRRDISELEVLLQQAGPAGAAPALASATSALLHPPRLVAREPEWAAAETAWRLGQVLLIEAEPGMGKSRLMAEFAAAHPDALLLAANAGDTHTPYALMVRLLRALMNRWRLAPPPWALAELARLLPELGAASALEAFTPRLLEAVRTTLSQAQEAGLSGLMIDNLHWSDTGSLAMLQGLLQAGDGLRWQFSCRAGQRPVALQAWLDQQPAQGHVQPLPPLQREGIQALLQSLGWAPRPALAWAAALEGRVLGNPLHVLELLIAIQREQGDAALAQTLPAPGAWPMPASLVQLVQARLQILSTGARRLARLAAVAQTEFSVALAERVLQATALDLGPAWHELEASHVLVDCGFAHDLLREALQTELPATIAREMHGRVAQAVALLGAAPARVAHHWLRAEQFAEAALWFERAAVNAALLNLRQEELTLWDQAAHSHDCLGCGEAAFRARSRALRASLLLERSRDTLERAQALQRAARDAAQTLEAWISLALVAQDRNDMQPWLEAGAEAYRFAQAQRRDDARLAADSAQLRAACVYANGLSFAGRHDEARGVLAPLSAAIEAGGDARAQELFHEAFGSVEVRAGNADLARRSFEQVLELAERRDDWSACMIASNNLAALGSRQGDYPSSLAMARRGEAWRQRLGGEMNSIVAAINTFATGIYQIQLGHYDPGMADLQRARQTFLACDAPQWIADCDTHLGRCWLYLGRSDLARQTLSTRLEGRDACATIRRLVELMVARWQGQDMLPLLHAAAQDFPDMRADSRMALDLMLARTLGGREGSRRAREVLLRADGLGLHALAQHARVVLAEALAADSAGGEAADVMAATVVNLQHRQPLGLYFPEVWCVAHRVFAAAGRIDEAAAALAQARAWILDNALPHIAADGRDAFLAGNPINRAVLSQ